jgi:hypothetical protein
LRAAQPAAAGIAAAAEPLSLDEQLVRVAALLSQQIGMVIAIAERSGGVIAKADLDSLSMLLRLAERLDALAEQHAAEQQKRSDDEVAGILERVDERIVELAHAHAERLGRGEPDE